MIAPLVVLRRGRRRLPAPHRARSSASGSRPSWPARASPPSCEIEPEEHVSTLVLGDEPPDGASRRRLRRRRRSRCSTPSSRRRPVGDEELERLRIRARHAALGHARSTTASCPRRPGSSERAISFTKGCYPGQEPVARLHYRGHAEPRRCACSRLDGAELPAYDAELTLRGQGASAGSRAPSRRRRRLALAYVRREVPDDAELDVTAPRARDTATLASPRARSSGDRALPCGGRGRKFESCRAHKGRGGAPSVLPRGPLSDTWHLFVGERRQSRHSRQLARIFRPRKG